MSPKKPQFWGNMVIIFITATQNYFKKSLWITFFVFLRLEQTVYSVSRFERAFQSIANHYLLLKLFGNTRLMNFFKNSSNSNESGNGTRKPWKLCVLPHSLEQVLYDLTNFFFNFSDSREKKCSKYNAISRYIFQAQDQFQSQKIFATIFWSWFFVIWKRLPCLHLWWKWKLSEDKTRTRYESSFVYVFLKKKSIKEICAQESIQNKFWCTTFWIFLGIPARVVAKTLVMLSEMKSKTDKLNAAQEMENEIIVMEDSLLKQLQQEPKSSISKPESSKKVSKQLEQVAETLMPERWGIFKKLFQYFPPFLEANFFQK